MAVTHMPALNTEANVGVTIQSDLQASLPTLRPAMSPAVETTTRLAVAQIASIFIGMEIRALAMLLALEMERSFTAAVI
ncbi:hypothetical protein H0H93_008257, partial [Arthromyces matolae]